MRLVFDFESKTPIYQQLRNQIVVGIAEGKLKAGEKLPTIRALADESGINMIIRVNIKLIFFLTVFFINTNVLS